MHSLFKPSCLFHSRCGPAFAVKAMLQLEAERTELLGVFDPLPGNQPDSRGRALTSNHQKHGAAGLVERVVHLVTLREVTRAKT